MATEITEDEVVKVPVPGKNRGGVWVTLGLEQYRVPPLGFGALRELQERIASLGKIAGAPTEDQMTTVTQIAHMAMTRNYPDMTLEDLTAMLDMQNFQPVLEAILSSSGYRRAKVGEAETANQSTGTDSTSS